MAIYLLSVEILQKEEKKGGGGLCFRLDLLVSDFLPETNGVGPQSSPLPVSCMRVHGFQPHNPWAPSPWP